MCGIAGIISLSPTKINASSVCAMIRQMRHRGDVEPSVRAFANGILGCARLAIVDRLHASQPMVDEQQQVAVVFNGEIYNHATLRAELQRAGRTFRTASDTEVLIQAFLEWGPSFTSRLEGMYAFVLLNLPKQSFLAARDPFGIKPLYYAINADGWYFSSEIGPLVNVGCTDILHVPPGGSVCDGVVSQRVLFPPLAPKKMDFEETRRSLRQAISQSVRAHLDCDLPVAVFCSGGIDSSIILFEASQVKREGLTAFTVGTEDSEDQRFARNLAYRLGVPFCRIPINRPDMVRSVPETVAAIESFEPNHMRTGTTSMALAKAVHDRGFKVALLGEGADELFGGYEEFPDTLRTTDSYAEVELLLRRFVSELYKTQLQRVDRTTMRYGIEARVPFLHSPLATFIQSIPTEFKVYRRPDGVVIGKHILREAYRGVLPDELVDRRKVPMGEGAGVGDNGPHGPFHTFCEERVSENALRETQTSFPQFNIRTREEAYYFNLFKDQFGALILAAERPRTNILGTR